MPNWKIEFLALKIQKFALKSFDPKTLGPRTKTTFYKFDAGEGGTICVLTPKMGLYLINDPIHKQMTDF